MATRRAGPSHPDHDHHGAGGGHAGADFPHLHDAPPLPQPGDPGPGIRARLGRSQALYLADGPGKVALRRAKNPAPNDSFGYVDRFLTVRSTGKVFPRGTLVVGVDAEARRTVDPETLRIFRWDAGAGAFGLVPRSGPGLTRDYVWGELTEPGLYGVVGIDAHPLVARAIGLLGYLEGFVALAPDEVLPRICELVLCAPEVRKAFADVGALTLLAEDNLRLGLPGPVPAGLEPAAGAALGGICETCLGLPRPAVPPARRPWLPELEILPHVCLRPAEHGGRWETRPEAAGVLAVHAALLRTGRVVYFGGSENVQAEHEAAGAEWDHTRVWDPATGNVRVVGSPPNHDLFCCGHALLGNGRLLAAGGTTAWAGVPVAGDPHGHAAAGHFRGAAAASTFDPGAPGNTNPWATVRRMRFERGTGQGGGRWYPTLVTLPDGRILAMAGHPEDSDTRHNNISLEAFAASPAPLGTWSDEGDQALTPDGYPRLHVVPRGAQAEVLCTHMADGMSWGWNPVTGAWRSLGTGPGGDYAGYGTTSVLLPLLPGEGHRARVLVMNAPTPRILDLGAATPTWQATAPRALAGSPWRYHATSVLLADGSVLLVGGLTNPYSNASALFTPERFDPATGAWSTVANASVPRVYHSVALLLPDGRVWTAGSDYGPDGHEMRMEVYSPAYLFRGPRPTISAAPGTLATGATLTVGTPDAGRIRSLAVIRCGSSTHAFNPDQRYVGLEILSRSGASLTAAAPPTRAVAPPGYYMLVAIDDAGVPSIGRFIRLT